MGHKIIDMSKINPERRLSKLLTTIEGMSNNEVLMVETDFDFKLLHCLMAGRSDLVIDYLETGPERWKIEIKKRSIMSHHESKKTPGGAYGGGSEWTKNSSDNYEYLKGTETSVGLNYIKKIWLNSDVADSLLSHNHWSITYMIHFIINSIHANILKLFVDINFYSERLNLEFETESHAIIDLVELLDELEDILINHLQKEEGFLFPIFMKMENIERYPGIKSRDTIRYSIKMMENEHEIIKGILSDLKKIFNQYNASQVSRESNTSMLFYLLDQLVEEINLLINLEDRILYPKAEKLEMQINSKKE